MSTAHHHHHHHQTRRDRLQALEARREQERRHMDDLLRQKDDILNKISNLESSLNDLDNCIDQLEEELLQDGDTEGVMILGQQGEASMDPTPTQEHLTDPTSQAQTQQQQQRQRPSVGRVSLETQLTEPGFQTQILEEEDDEDEEGIFPNQSASRPARPSSAGSTFGQLEITTVAKKKRAPKANNSSTISNNAAAGTARIDNFFAQNNIAQRSLVPPPAAAAATAASTNTTTQSPATFVAAPTTAAVAAAISNSHSITSNNQFNRSDFPWSNQVHNLLRNTFRIESFREHQEAVINATLAKEDVFVIMRTGGGKSLTYQLTALLEGRGQPRGQPGQITFVISPLLSLIKDQEDQMNQFARGSAISFSSNLPGGQSEHARRWGLVRDPSAGVCLVFVTPEKVHASNKLKSELQKLHEQNRLGRFVIDECHCASSWGHDFRPDYTKLGILRHHFPRVPILAVTATASDRVRTDVCDILNMSHKYNFFRSSANRPNLTYEVRPKKSSGSGDAVLDDMAAFIKERYPDAAGIVYTLSKKDANTVAGKLLEHGILAEPYHSDVGASKKAEVHQNWMSNRTKVVVATVAFGLGINKPDVRYVLHHSISKNLEAYYQESGRAGRDGKNSQCILYYSPKDVVRMLKMVHGESKGAEDSFWQMVRYAQQCGGDEVCRATLLTVLGEPSSIDRSAALNRQLQEGETIERREIGKHAQTVAKILQEKTNQGDNVPLSTLVKEWRTKPANALSCVKQNPPGNELNAEECERTIVELVLHKIFRTYVVWTAYDSNIYLQLTERGRKFLQSSEPKVSMTFPKHEKRARKNATLENDDDSTAVKPAAKKRAKRSSSAASKTKVTAKSKKKKKGNAKARDTQQSPAPTEVIELCDSSDDEVVVEEMETTRSKRPVRAARSRAQVAVQNTLLAEDDFYDSHCSDEENEFAG